MSARKRKIRVDFKKNRGKRSRAGHEWREAVRQDQTDDLNADERISGKGNLSRKRTVIAEESEDGELIASLDVDVKDCLTGRVLSIVGSHQCRVQSEDGRVHVCAVRQVLRTLMKESRNTVVAGDIVLFEPLGDAQGMIHRVEPRRGTLGRGNDRNQQLIVVNVDLAVIVVTGVSPHFKPSLIDRFLISCEKGNVSPVICINKSDLFNYRELLPIVGQYANLGYPVVLTSAHTGYGIDQLREIIAGRQTVFSGQSGVGKTSLLNMIQPGLALKTSQVSIDSGKGRHTTRTATLQALEFGGWVVDTPGIRQLRLWDVGREEVEGHFIEFLPLVRYCKYPNCMHIHEQQCGIRDAVAAGLISARRYDSYLKILNDDES
ncbi:ribosome small subunit-dependent GTPase A [Rubinisphaera italica]|uniref:Small ribosomal subunit biogenesis GTPase RsgA n=1 Tax=Rubinisphaera italica TaxID=2527969 RepID=A0A5C5XNS3_9PLAN|nr:ribosome small subunit-dependent GTPase A [Rubinisphaera italica]TWT64544.1 putative ribosome biogenesis GTPase RsgA [Rubinisphaera italica]